MQNLTYDSVVSAVSMCDKNEFQCGFFVNSHIYPSIYAFFVAPTGHIFGAILKLSGSNDAFSQR